MANDLDELSEQLKTKIIKDHFGDLFESCLSLSVNYFVLWTDD